jgi:hypothetical protein
MTVEYHLIFPKTQIQFDATQLTFSIEHIKSRFTSVLYFILRCYDKDDNLIYAYKSPRWVIDTIYKRRFKTFDIGGNIVDETVYTQLELVSVGTSSENPLYFNGLMLNTGKDLGGHHTPNEQVTRSVGFINTRFANLYNVDGNFLQVIRPSGKAFTTDRLEKDGCTVIAPHFYDEDDVDDPINIFYEFINQTEQRIDVLR